jgi:hypothetical protein
MRRAARGQKGKRGARKALHASTPSPARARRGRCIGRHKLCLTHMRPTHGACAASCLGAQECALMSDGRRAARVEGRGGGRQLSLIASCARQLLATPCTAAWHTHAAREPGPKSRGHCCTPGACLLGWSAGVLPPATAATLSHTQSKASRGHVLPCHLAPQTRAHHTRHSASAVCAPATEPARACQQEAPTLSASSSTEEQLRGGGAGERSSRTRHTQQPRAEADSYRHL